MRPIHDAISMVMFDRVVMDVVKATLEIRVIANQIQHHAISTERRWVGGANPA